MALGVRSRKLSNGSRRSVAEATTSLLRMPRGAAKRVERFLACRWWVLNIILTVSHAICGRAVHFAFASTLTVGGHKWCDWVPGPFGENH
jgi:hypothetical protein